MSLQKYRCNDEIKSKYVYLIDENGEAKGEIIRAEALHRAKETELDLVEIQPNKKNDDYPVCRIMDYGKFLYNKQKKQDQSKKSQKKPSIKGMRFTTNIAEHDFNVKMSQVRKFLEKGDKVRIAINVSNKRGGMEVIQEKANDMLGEIEVALEDIASFEKNNVKSGGYGKFFMNAVPLGEHSSEHTQSSQNKSNKSKQKPRI